MRVIVSVQSQSKSTRGLVHYIAHSKIDPTRESLGSRNLFDDRSDLINVEQANFSLKPGVSTNRPRNEDLMHLVVSFRPADYKRLGADEKERRKSLREITRTSMRNLEKTVGAESLDWAAAIHRNTDNPHVHIAISKHFLLLEKGKHEMLKRIPTSALPHYELVDQKKVFVPGVLMETAAKKMDEIIARNPTRELVRSEHERAAEKVPEMTPAHQPIAQEARNPKQHIHESIHIR
ncbi:MAG: relaxase MobL [Pyrinomonadaceae bacterium]